MIAGMTRAITLCQSLRTAPLEAARMAIVYGCALALIAVDFIR